MVHSRWTDAVVILLALMHAMHLQWRRAVATLGIPLCTGCVQGGKAGERSGLDTLASGSLGDSKETITAAATMQTLLAVALGVNNHNS